MFPRAYIKATSRTRMQGYLGNAILVSLIASILGGGMAFKTTFSTNAMNTVKEVMSGDKFTAMMALLFPAMFVFFALGLAYTIFVGNVIAVGNCGWYLRYWRGEYPGVGELFAGFRIYKPAVLVSLLQSLLVYVGTLLCVVPGIIFTYMFRMTNYIIYENPNLPPKRALEMSKIMTTGAKLDLFVYDLSFIGWSLLAVITCGIVGIVYVSPYVGTSQAGIYESLKESAIRRGVLTWEDFGVTAEQ